MENHNKDLKVPEGWRRVKLGEVLFFSKGKAPREFYDFEEDNTVGYLSPEFLRKQMTKLRYCKTEQAVIANNNVVILWDGSNAGEIFFARSGALASTMVRIDIISDIWNEYLYYHLKFYEYIIKYQIKGSGIPHVEKDIFDILPNIFPPLPEQQRIAEFLETVDNAIEKTDQIIEKYKRIKQGLMQDLLTKGVVSDELGIMGAGWRLRDEKRDKFKDSPLGKIPEEWEVVRLGDVAKLRNKKTFLIKDEKYLGLENIEAGTGRLIGYIPSDTIKGLANIFEEGDVLFGKLRPNLRKFLFANFRGFCSTEIYVIHTSTSSISKIFLYFTIISESFLKLAESKVFGTKMPRTSWEILKTYFFPLPPLPEQQRIASILSQIDETIEKETAYKEKLQRLKLGLMEDLLTGKVRVNLLIKEKN